MQTWKRWVAVKLLVSVALLTTACGGAKLDGVWYDSFGLANDISLESLVWCMRSAHPVWRGQCC